MEENYQKTQAHTNSCVYKDTFKKAFQWPGIGYTLLIWGACYGVIRALPFARIAEKLNEYMSTEIFWGTVTLYYWPG